LLDVLEVGDFGTGGVQREDERTSSGSEDEDEIHVGQQPNPAAARIVE